MIGERTHGCHLQLEVTHRRAMRVFSKAAAGAFVGKCFASLLIAICVALGFGPEQWASFLLGDLSGYLGRVLARIGFLALGFTTFAFLARPWIERRRRTNQNFRGHPIGWKWSGWKISNSDQRFSGLQFTGKNVTKEDLVKLHDIFITSLINGVKLSPMVLLGGEMIRPDETNPIVPQAEFMIVADFPNNEMLTEDEFLSLWGKISIKTHTGKLHYAVSFDEPTIRASFARFHSDPEPTPPTPYVTRSR